MPNLINTPLLEGEYEDVPAAQEGDDLREQVEFLTQQFASLSAQVTQIKRALATAAGTVAVTSTEGTSSKWDIIKQRLEPRLSRAIDILLLQSPLSGTQLAAAMRIDRGNCSKNVVAPLLRQGLIVRNGHNLSLRSL